MKTYEEYIKIPYKMEIIPDKDEGGYIAIFPELPGCLTCGDTFQEIIENAQDAKCEWIRAAMESGIEIPEPTYDNFKLNIYMMKGNQNGQNNRNPNPSPLYKIRAVSQIKRCRRHRRNRQAGNKRRFSQD